MIDMLEEVLAGDILCEAGNWLGYMMLSGAIALEKQKLQLVLPRSVVRILDRYRGSQIPIRSRNLLIGELIVEALRARGIEVCPEGEQNGQE